MKRKYADYIYSVKKTHNGYVWTIWGDDWKPMLTSLDNEDEDDRYFKTQGMAAGECIEAIQDHYN